MDIDDYLNLQSHSDGSTLDLQDMIMANQDNPNNNSDTNSTRVGSTTTATAAVATIAAATTTEATTTSATEMVPHDSVANSYPLSSTTSSSTSCWNDDLGLGASETDNVNRLFDKTPLPPDVEQFLYSFGSHADLLSSHQNWALLTQATHDQQALSSLPPMPLTDRTATTSCLPDFLAPQFLTLTTTAAPSLMANTSMDTTEETAGNNTTHPQPLPVTTTITAAAAAAAEEEEATTADPATVATTEAAPTRSSGMVTRAKRQRSVDVVSKASSTSSPSPTVASPPAKKKRGKKLYCICQQPYDGQPMVQCDGCKEWFHCVCVSLDADEVENVDWICDTCKPDGSSADDATQPDSTESMEQVTTPQDQLKTSTRHIRHQHTCLLTTCNNHTRADSYCSDVCARLGLGGNSIQSRSRRRTKAPTTTTSIIGTTDRLEAESPTIEATDRLTPQTNEPEAVTMVDPIRKNVLKNLTTTLTPILTRVTDELPEALATQVTNDPLEAAEALAAQIENAIYDYLGDDGDNGSKLCGTRYKVKVRSLLYNLRDKANQEFQRRVVRGDMSTETLAQMSSEDMANPELKSMSESLREKSIKNSVLKVENMPIIKKTHKGDIIMMPKEKKPSSKDRSSLPKLTTTSSSKDFNNATKLPTTPSFSASPSSASTASVKPTALANINKETMDELWKQIGITGSSETMEKQSEVEIGRRKKSSVDLEALLGAEDEDMDLYAGEDDEGDHSNLTGCWSGRVDMPDVASFDAQARQIGGRTLNQQEWHDILPSVMFVEGRIQMDSANKYVSSLDQSTSRDVVLLEVVCQSSTAANERHMQTLLNYFECRKRYGVVGHDKVKIKDFYLWPLYKSQPMPRALRAVSVEDKPRDVDMLLGVLVISKPRPGQPTPPPHGKQQAHHQYNPLPQSLHIQQDPPPFPYQQQQQRYQSQQQRPPSFPQLSNSSEPVNHSSQTPYNPSYPSYYPS